MPVVLFLQLARWDYDVVCQKATPLDQYVSIPEQHRFNGVAYELRAVVFHRGASAKSGHYWTCSEHNVTGKRSWWFYSDTYIYIYMRQARGSEPRS